MNEDPTRNNAEFGEVSESSADESQTASIADPTSYNPALDSTGDHIELY